MGLRTRRRGGLQLTRTALHLAEQREEVRGRNPPPPPPRSTARPRGPTHCQRPSGERRGVEGRGGVEGQLGVVRPTRCAMVNGWGGALPRGRIVPPRRAQWGVAAACPRGGSGVVRSHSGIYRRRGHGVGEGNAGPPHPCAPQRALGSGRGAAGGGATEGSGLWFRANPTAWGRCDPRWERGPTAGMTDLRALCPSVWLRLRSPKGFGLGKGMR